MAGVEGRDVGVLAADAAGGNSGDAGTHFAAWDRGLVRCDLRIPVVGVEEGYLVEI